MLDDPTIRRAPKVLLHDHLDGGLRSETVIDLAREAGYTALPTQDPAELQAWFTRGADRKSLELYLEGFAHTVALMQTRDAIERVSAECVEDLAADGLFYAEVRYAPELSTAAGLSLDEAVESVLAGFERGIAAAAAVGRPILVRFLCTAMRQYARSVEIAELAVRWRDRGCVGFDIAGPEKGFPPTRHLDAFHLVQRENFHSTIHAGESFGLPSIWEALQWCGAARLGHAVRIVDDITIDGNGRAHHWSASHIDGRPNDSPAWIVEWKFSRWTRWKASRWRVGGKPFSGPAMSKPTQPRSRQRTASSAISTDRAYWRMAVHRKRTTIGRRAAAAAAMPRSKPSRTTSTTSSSESPAPVESSGAWRTSA